MVSEAPPFWWTKIGWQAVALYPASLVYGLISGSRMARAKRIPVDCPVICVGNFTAGGAGKTPTVIALARAAKSMGLKPGLLSRGYGGLIDHTTVVDPHHHNARGVGDEPLLLAREAPTVISRNRVDGARRLIAEGADLIIMDDGFQSARIAIDYALIVVDGMRGLGNGLPIPSGPVRAPLKEQVRHVTALLAVGGGNAADPFVRRMSRVGKPSYQAVVATRNAETFAGKKVMAFAGIADPGKFFRSLEAAGAEIAVTRTFPDHHYLDDFEIDTLLKDAAAQDLLLVTTAKDHVRLQGGHGKSEDLAERAKVLEVAMTFDDPAVPASIIGEALKTYRKRKLLGKS
jgi:tetraacyldisaccharide 4'-kinase